MKFGAVPIDEAEGAILAHSVALAPGAEGRKRRLRKGQVLEAGDVAALRAQGHSSVVVARLEPGDIHEDEAAAALAEALAWGRAAGLDPGKDTGNGAGNGAGQTLAATRPFTGRVNLVARGPGVARVDAARIDAVNAVHPMITVATVPPFQQMAARGMVATVKIISYAVPGDDLARAVAQARGTHPALALAEPAQRSAVLIITEIPGGPGEKGRDAIGARLAALDVALDAVIRVPHETAALAAALRECAAGMVLILTGSATSDAHDVAPEALCAAGGRLIHFGMPVDPGNLLFLGELPGEAGARPVIGLPGCARSPALNGADWVLSRIICGIDVSGAEIAAMGVGGLLKESPARPMPRAGRKPRA